MWNGQRGQQPGMKRTLIVDRRGVVSKSRVGVGEGVTKDVTKGVPGELMATISSSARASSRIISYLRHAKKRMDRWMEMVKGTYKWVGCGGVGGVNTYTLWVCECVCVRGGGREVGSPC